ncbi:MAG TPA: DsbA family protein [Candidatus Thermoplasmatota archaeon]|nr:DsbA family protein [Candidatus Thermoplasmatota archaeon]
MEEGTVSPQLGSREGSRSAAEATASPWALAHAEEVGRSFEPAPAGKVRVELLTDPWSVWCWGMEPVRRAIEVRFPTIEFRPLVGGMFPRLPDPREIGFDVERFFAVVQRTTGMPLRVDATRKDRPESTYPACVHVHVVRLLAPEKEAAYLRALREAVYLDARNVSRVEVAADVAEAVGVPAAEFREALESGEPLREFHSRMSMLNSLGLHAYPTVFVTWRDKTARVQGFQSLPALLGVVESVTGTMHAVLDAPPVAELVPGGERVATREIAEVLGTSVEQAHDRLMDEVRAGTLVRVRLDTGDVFRRRT